MRSFVIRLTAGMLLAYGCAGIVGSLWIALRAADVFQEARELVQAATPEDSAVLARTIGRSLGRAAGATNAGAASLGRAQESLRAGASTSDELAQAMSILATAMSFDVLGARPFGEVAAPIDRTSKQLDVLSDSLSRTDLSIEATRGEFAALEVELRSLQEQTDRVAARLTRATESAAINRTISSAEWLSNIVIGGFALQSVLFLAIGGALLMIPSDGSR